MAYSFGGGVQAQLGATDYSSYLRGSLKGAEGVAAGGAAIGQGIANLGQSIGTAITEGQKKKKEKAAVDGAVDIITPIVNNAEVQRMLNIPKDATPDEIKAGIRKGVAAFGAAKFLDMAKEARGQVAYGAGIGAIPQHVTERFSEMQSVPTLPDAANLAQAADFSAPPSMIRNAPQQDVGDFMQTGKMTFNAPNMVAESLSNPKVKDTKSTTEYAPIPNNISQWYTRNPVTGKLVEKGSLYKDTLKTAQEVKQNSLFIEKLEDQLKSGTVAAMESPGRFGGMGSPARPYSGEEVEARSKSLEQAKARQEELKGSLIDQSNARELASELNSPNAADKSVEKKASSVINNSLRFADQVDLNKTDKAQWSTMKEVVKEIPRKATDEEKVAAFVSAYSKIAPIDSGVYFKMKQVFDTDTIISDVGGGNNIVTVNGKSFLIPSGEKAVPVNQKDYNNKTNYYELLGFAKSIGGLAEFKRQHAGAYSTLETLNARYGDKNLLTGGRIPLEENSFFQQESGQNQSSNKRQEREQWLNDPANKNHPSYQQVLAKHNSGA
tara:strand:+ start:1434 stop:3086 length:1653 start_codon:yes stop_codon:yes gene_type:complete